MYMKKEVDVKEKSKRIASLLLAGLILISILGGCSAGKSSQKNEEPSSEIAASSKPVSGDFTGVTIEYACCFNEAEPHGQWVIAQAKAWEEKTGGTVKLNMIGRDVLTQIKSRVLAGDAPDIVDQDLSELQAAFLTDEVMLQPIDDVLDTTIEGDSGSLRDQINDGYKMYTMGETNYFVPYITITSGFFYNKNLFVKHNIDVPNTWEEFIDVCDVLKNAGVAPLALDGNISFYNAYYYTFACQRVLGTGAFMKAATDESGSTWDDPGYLEAAKMVESLSKRGRNFFQQGYEGSAYPAAQGEWAQGEYGMVFCGTWIPSETNAQTDEDFAYGYFPFPSVDGGRGKATELEMQTMGFCIPKDAKNVEAAKDFILFCSTKENADKFVETSANISARQDARAPQFLDDVIPYVDGASEFFQNYDGVMGKAPEWWANVFYPADDALVFGSMSAEDFVKQIKEETIKFYENKQ